MSNFICDKCGVVLYDSPTGYITGCEHYPKDSLELNRQRCKDFADAHVSGFIESFDIERANKLLPKSSAPTELMEGE
ncbi:MAG: hypothetical protein BV459_04990 [Thermoplasmata archaeon M11B2D]|nr:MAG: hypothetical protein BV459_04990 [Thermoplasmata archaeon M11B2D]